VVAAEVRSLAQRSAAAAKEIKGLIQDTLKKVDRGIELVNKSGDTLQTIVTSVHRVTDMVSEISAAAQEQSAGIDQVNSAVTQIDQVTQSNSAQTEELSSTAQALSEQSHRLIKLVSIFKLTQGGNEDAALDIPQRASTSVLKMPAKAPRSSRPMQKAGTVKIGLQSRHGVLHPAEPAATAVLVDHDVNSSFEEF
jgi:uncharacterized phage infection (PIP) family protein YhgE